MHNAMKAAARQGHFEVLLFLHANRSEGCPRNAISAAYKCIKHMEVVQWVYPKYPEAVNLRFMSDCDSYMREVLYHTLQWRE